MKKILIVCLLTVGCSDIPIDNQIQATRTSLTEAQRGALGYVDQPLCGTPDGDKATICSKPSVIKKIKMADNAAMVAIEAAEKAKTEESLKIAQTLFHALLEITSNILSEK